MVAETDKPYKTKQTNKYELLRIQEFSLKYDVFFTMYKTIGGLVTLATLVRSIYLYTDYFPFIAVPLINEYLLKY